MNQDLSRFKIVLMAGQKKAKNFGVKSQENGEKEKI
jgi:hypothetical protein